jgi:hypothetical protein
VNEIDHSEDICVDVMIILKLILDTSVGSVDWIHIPQNRDQWRSLLNTIMNILVLYE